MNFLKLITTLMLILAGTLANASSLQCRNLFTASNKLITEADIEKRIVDLAVNYLQLADINSELKQQAIANMNQELSALMQVNEKALLLFKQKVSELRDQITKSQKQKIKEDELIKKERRNVIEDHSPVNLAKKIIFHEIKPGKFKMNIDAQIKTEITNSFAMMDTPVTQMMWARLKIAMGEKDLEKINPAHFKTGEDSIPVNIEGLWVDMKPNHPVEQVSYTDIIEFLAGLNKLSNSNQVKDQDLLKNLIPDHQKGDVYDLPTEAQWEFVMRNRGKANKKYFNRDDATDLDKYAWFATNSDNKTHEVATKLPRIIDGKAFFDLEGNVTEWCKDWYNHKLEGSIDPQGPNYGHLRVIRGGNWFTYAPFLGSGARDKLEPDAIDEAAGFRLVRVIPNNN